MRRKATSTFTTRHKRRLASEEVASELNLIDDSSDSDQGLSEASLQQSVSDSSENSSPIDVSVDNNSENDEFSTVSSFDYDIDQIESHPVNNLQNNCLPSSSNIEIREGMVSNDLPDNFSDSESESSTIGSLDYRYSDSDLSDIDDLDDFDDFNINRNEENVQHDNNNVDYWLDETEEKETKFRCTMRSILQGQGVDQITTNRILWCLNEYSGTKFPKDARTFFGTPQKTPIFQIEGGDYYHFGLGRALKKIITDTDENKLSNTSTINLLVNIDGAPLHKSTSKGIWIIQCSSNLTDRTYLIGIFYGLGKPLDTDQFLRMLVDDLKHFTENGFQFLDQFYSVVLEAFICDAPAKSMILNAKGHTGYHSCPTCKIVGVADGHVVCFPYEENIVPRTDEEFRNNEYLDTYQMGETILKEIRDFDFISGVPRDYMHLICLGVTRKLLFLWKFGPFFIKLSREELEIISNRLEHFSDFMPTEFARRPRSLKHIKQWKATECRQFLLYTGLVALNDVLDEETYEHFIMLHFAMRLLIDPEKVSDPTNINLAEQLLREFVSRFENIYDLRYMSYNIHNLIHLADDVRIYGALDNFAAFKFENFIFFIKKLLRKHDQCLQQIVRRYTELELAGIHIIRNKRIDIAEEEFKVTHTQGPIVDELRSGIQYKKYKFGSISLDCNDQRNNSVLITNNVPIRCLNFIRKDGRVYVVGRIFRDLENIYNVNLENQISFFSSEINCFKVVEGEEVGYWQCDQIQKKMCVLPMGNELAIMPLLH